MTTIYLTAGEKKTFDRLAENFKEGWTIKDEMQTSYETDQQLRMRYHMASFPKYDIVKRMAEKVIAGAKPESLSMNDIPDDLLPDFFFTIGARGTSVFIGHLLVNIRNDEDIRGLANLTFIRHELLANNAVPA